MLFGFMGAGIGGAMLGGIVGTAVCGIAAAIVCAISEGIEATMITIMVIAGGAALLFLIMAL